MLCFVAAKDYFYTPCHQERQFLGASVVVPELDVFDHHTAHANVGFHFYYGWHEKKIPCYNPACKKKVDPPQKKPYPTGMTLSEQLRAYLSGIRKKAALKIPRKLRVSRARHAAEARWGNGPHVCPVCGSEHASIKDLAAHRRAVKACRAKRGRPKKEKC